MMDTSDFGDVVWGKDVETDAIIDSLFGPATNKLKSKKLGKKRKRSEDESTTTPAKLMHCSESVKNLEIKKQDKKTKKQVDCSVGQEIITECIVMEKSNKKTKQNKIKSKLCPPVSIQSEHGEINKIPKKSRKNKYYDLALSAKKGLNEEPHLAMEHFEAVAEDASNKFCSQAKQNSGSEHLSKKASDFKKKRSESKLDIFDGRTQTQTLCESKDDEYVDSKGKGQTPLKQTKKIKNKKSNFQVDKESAKSTSIKGITLSKGQNHKTSSRKSSKHSASEQEEDTTCTIKANAKGATFNIAKLRTILSGQSADGKTAVKSLPDVKGTPDQPKGLKQRMQEQLKSARFRHLNEQLYTTTGSEAFTLFKQDRQAFHVYHEGFQHQVTKWPDNPLDRVIQYVRDSPETHVVVDFGCGDAKLAESVPQKVHSFDFVAVNQRVTACNMAHIPLAAASVDIGVFCLSLMGTNLLDYLLEAHRLLKLGGVLVIAEVLSRFEKLGSFVRKLEKLGFILLEKDRSNKMFVWFEFRKVAGYDKDFLPKIVLQPCIYKRR